MNKTLKLPTSKTGKDALDASILFISLMIITKFICLHLPNFIMALIGFVSFIYSLIAIIKYKDRSIWLLLPVACGFFAILWTLLGQVITITF